MYELCEDQCQKLKRSVCGYSVKGRRIDVLWIRVCRSIVTRIKDAKRLFTGLIKALLILTRGKMELRMVDFKSVCEKTGLDSGKISTRLFQLKVPPCRF